MVRRFAPVAYRRAPSILPHGGYELVESATLQLELGSAIVASGFESGFVAQGVGIDEFNHIAKFNSCLSPVRARAMFRG
jgi:hypothetical protein